MRWKIVRRQYTVRDTISMTSIMPFVLSGWDGNATKVINYKYINRLYSKNSFGGDLLRTANPSRWPDYHWSEKHLTTSDLPLVLPSSCLGGTDGEPDHQNVGSETPPVDSDWTSSFVRSIIRDLTTISSVSQLLDMKIFHWKWKRHNILTTIE